MPFLDSLDIANRALQHCGVNPILSVTEDTTNNNEVSAVYDKVRRAELRRNAWRFAIRKTVIRPLTSTMLEIVPAPYSATTLYKNGELVADLNNLIWISTMADNIGNSPGGNNNAWDMFFGPMTVDVWQAPQTNNIGSSYQSGELVYIQNFQSNLLVNSGNLLNTQTWSQSNLAATNSTIIDPVGGLTATTLTDTVSNINHFLQQQKTLVAGQTYTWSIYIQPGTLQSIALNYGGSIIYLFNASTGIVTNNAGSATTTMTSVGGGWYRATMTFVATSSVGINTEMVNLSNAISYSGGSGTINIWGPQLDLGTVAQNYNATPPLPQGYSVFMSLTNNNQDTPNVAQAWNATTQYYQDQIVNYAGFNWRSLLPYNLGNPPVAVPGLWSAVTSYVATNTVIGSDNYIYSAVAGSVGINPVTDAGAHWTNTGVLAAWTNTPTLVPQDINWRALTCTLKNLLPLWPVGSGPTNQTTTRNVYRLPAGYVGPAPQNPKQGVMTFLGGPSGNNEPDWELEGNFIVTVWTQPIIIRFVADIAKVTQMDDMFCEGLACRIAQMVCKRLTGSGELTGQISQAYKLFMGEARLKNGIESGTQEPYEDDYVTVRI